MRGYVFMLESVLAGILLVGFMLFLAHSYTQARPYEPDFSDVLTELDDQELLRGYAYSGDASGLEAEISLPGYSHSVQLCDSAGSCTGEIPNQREVRVSSYFLAGETDLEPMEVKLFVWQT
jgi:hypothetical protein